MRVLPINNNIYDRTNIDNRKFNVIPDSDIQNNVSFKAGKNAGENIFKRLYKKCRDSFNYAYDKVTTGYGKYILKSDKVRSFSEWLYSKDSSNATKHFAVVGAFVTSAAYAYNTLKNNKLEKKNSTTLAINQALGWVVPTLLGYLIDSGIAEHTKEIEYNFAAKITKAMKMSALDSKEYNEALERTVKQIKGVRTIAGIVTFTLLYRYLAPVFIAPVANKLGEWVGKKSDKKLADKQQIVQNQVELAKA